MITISPTASYEVDVPAGIHQDIDDRVTSLWLEGSQLALQLSSFTRSEGVQVLAAIEDVAAAVTTDSEGTAWVHAYLTWPDLCIYATLSGPPEQIADAENWAHTALSSLRRAKPA